MQSPLTLKCAAAVDIDLGGAGLSLKREGGVDVDVGGPGLSV